MEHKKNEDVGSMLNEIKDDLTVPKNVRARIEKVIGILSEAKEMPIKISKALNELEVIADDVNLQSYTRTQIWNVISELEKIKSD